MSDETPTIAETVVGLLLVGVFSVAWYQGKIPMAFLSLVLLTAIAMARTGAKHL